MIVRMKWLLIASLMSRTKTVNEGSDCAAIASEPAKISLNLGMTTHHQNAHDGRGHDHDGAGIEHGGDDLAFDLLRFFHEFGQTLEDDFQHAADFARLDHVDKEAVENLGMLGQSLGKGAAAFDGNGQIAQNALEVGASSCFCSTRKPRSNGSPACTRVANWRVKVVSTFDLTRPLKPGILIWKLRSTPPFLPLAGAFLAPPGAGRPLSSTTLVGKKPISLMRPMASFWLATSSVPLVSLPRESMAT